MSDQAPTTSCLNCGAALTGPFCAQCGQHLTDTDMSLRELLRGTIHELTAIDGKVLRTLGTLFRSPGQLTVDALAGRRARWLPPLRVYLICSIVYFVSGPVIERVTHRSAQEMARARFQLKDESGLPVTVLSPEDRQRMAEGLPARIYGIDRLERAAQNPARLSQQISSAFQQAMFVLLPLFALLTWVAWWRRGRYPAHLYLALHLHAAWFGIIVLLNIIVAFLPLPVATVVGFAGVCVIAVYTLLAFRRVFGGTWPATIVRAVAIGFAYMLCLTVTGVLLLGLALFTM